MKSKCSHFWVIGEPNGEESRGVCKYCGAVEKFWNSISGASNAKIKPSIRRSYARRGRPMRCE